MISKGFKKVISCVITTTMMGAMLIAPSNVLAVETSSTAIAKETKARVSVHDPSIVKEGANYYVFGSHIEAAKSTDLKNWTKFTNGYTTPNNVLFGDLSSNLEGSFAWAGENDSDSKGGFSVWAPYVFWNADYVNKDNSKGAYMMYYSTSSTYKRSAIGYAVSQNIEGPYTYVDTIMYSGFTKDTAYDANSLIDTKYTNPKINIQGLLDNHTLLGVKDSWFNADGSYNTSTAPNAIDPALFYDTTGKLHMVYGSWAGGIFELEMDKATGKAIYPGVDGTSVGGNAIDRYFGTRISGGYTDSGEGPFVVYDNTTKDYYLYVTYAGLSSTGGYNMRMFKSKNPDGPYLDAAGNNAVLPSQIDNASVGIKLIGNYQFSCLDEGYRAGGHNSSFIDSDGQMYLIYHTRFNSGTEYHEVRVHQMFKNEDGWPVVAPYEYDGDAISTTGYSMDKISGTYEFINHGNSNNGTPMINTLSVNLNADKTITGDATGTWNSTEGSNYMSIIIDGVTYKGVFFEQQDESKNVSKVMTFSALGSNNQSIWGSKMETDSDTVRYEAMRLQDNTTTSTKVDLTLPTAGVYGTSISWYSSNSSVLDNNGIVNALKSNVDVILTAQITKGEVVVSKDFTVTVKGKIVEIKSSPIYKYDFNILSGPTEVLNSGSNSENATLVGSASIVQDDQRGKVLQIKSSTADKKINYLALPSDTFKSMTKDGYTVGMWVNVDSTDSNYSQWSSLFEATANNTFPVTKMGTNLISRINSNGAWADTTATELTANTWQYVTYTVNTAGIIVYLNGKQVAIAKNDLTACFADGVLATINDVRVGSGNIWGDMDIASAKFDNVAIYNTALTEDEVDALYSKETVAPIYKYDFSTLKGSTEVLNSGDIAGDATLVGSAAVVQDDQRGKVLQIKSATTDKKINYLALPSDTFKSMTKDGYTVGMWVNADTTDPNYSQWSSLFEATANNTFPVTKMGVNLVSRINANGAWADTTATELTANTWQYVTYTVNTAGIIVYLNGKQVAIAKNDLTACFADGVLATLNDVRVGSGNVWDDMDIASAKFDDVAIYNTVLTPDKVESLYNDETKTIVIDKTALTTAIGDATILIGSKTVGTVSGNVPQVAKDTFQSAITIASTINVNVGATQAEVDAQVSLLAIATTNFNNAVIVISTPVINGGGSTSTPAPVVTTPVVTVPVITQIDNNSNVVATLDSSKIDNSKVNVIQIDQPKPESKVSVQIPASAIGTGTGSFEINTKSASLSLPTSIIDSSFLSSGGTLQVSQNQMATTDANILLANIPAGAKTNGKVFTFGMTVYDSNNNVVRDIHNFANGKSVGVTINLSVDDIKGMDTSKISAFYFDVTSNKWVEITGTFDSVKMTYTFNTTHFTDFTIMQKSAVNVNRLFGINRIETSIAIAKEQYSNTKPDAVVLATANVFADALAGSGLAYKYNAPLLLVNKAVRDNEAVLEYITTNLSKGKSIYILGETGVVSQAVSDYLSKQGYTIVRLGGKDRYETNQKIVDYLNVTKGTSMVMATGDDFADALSISSISDIKGFPVLLNAKDNLSASVRSYIISLEPTTIYVVGGTGVLSINIEEQIKKINGDIKIVRLGGKDRYETSMIIASNFNLDTTTIAIATGVDFPDALSGSVLAARKNSAVLLVDNKDVAKQKELLSKEKITNVIVFGGQGVIRDDIVNSLLQK